VGKPKSIGFEDGVTIALAQLQALEYWMWALLQTAEHRDPRFCTRPENVGARSALQFLAMRVRRARRELGLHATAASIGEQIAELARFCTFASNASRQCDLSRGEAVYLASLGYRLEIEDALQRLNSLVPGSAPASAQSR
jgi:hypothetical protein